MPHSHDASTNIRIAPTNSFTWPMRCVSQPVSGIETALAAANTVITHVPSSTETPRLPEIVGIATLAIDVSSTFMKVASATAMVARTSLPPSSGGGAGGCDDGCDGRCGVGSDGGAEAGASGGWLKRFLRMRAAHRARRHAGRAECAG